MKNIKEMNKRNLILNIIVILAIIGFIVYAETNKRAFGLTNLRLVKLCCIYAICALSMNTVNGFTGMFSLGQPGFMAIGAYVTALFTVDKAQKMSIYTIEPLAENGIIANMHAPFFVALIIGGLIAALFAFFIGFPVLRLEGDYLAIASLGFSEIIRILITNLTGITNGPTGITGIPNTYMNLYVIAGILALIVIFMIAMIRSSYGRALLAIREDEVAAQAMGVNLFKHKMIAFVLSGFVAGIGGGLLAAYTQAIDPKMFQFTVAYEILLMVVLGGQGSVTGSVVGAFIVRIAMEKLRFLDGTIDFGFFEYKGIEGMRMVVFSALLMLVIILWRRGIFGNKEFSWNSIFAFFARFKKSPDKEVQN